LEQKDVVEQNETVKKQMQNIEKGASYTTTTIKTFQFQPTSAKKQQSTSSNNSISRISCRMDGRSVCQSVGLTYRGWLQQLRWWWVTLAVLVVVADAAAAALCDSFSTKFVEPLNRSRRCCCRCIVLPQNVHNRKCSLPHPP